MTLCVYSRACLSRQVVKGEKMLEKYIERDYWEPCLSKRSLEFPFWRYSNHKDFILPSGSSLEYKSGNHTNVAHGNSTLNYSLICIHVHLQCGKHTSIFNHSPENWGLWLLSRVSSSNTSIWRTLITHAYAHICTQERVERERDWLCWEHRKDFYGLVFHLVEEMSMT